MPSERPDCKILLVDDSERIRALVRAILEDLRCDVIDAGDAETAVREAGSGHKIDLLITDFQMPGMSGLELADRLRKNAPGLKVLCMSGYGFPQTPAASGVHFIQKPFPPDVLLERVRTLLGF